MRRPLRLALCLAALMIGCTPESPSPPPMEPVEAEVAPSPVAKSSPRPLAKKPPGLQSAVPRASTAERAKR
jgi:hypothetical protein